MDYDTNGESRSEELLNHDDPYTWFFDAEDAPRTTNPLLGIGVALGAVLLVLVLGLAAFAAL
ncbi:hypothetical protein [Streptomyces sp. NPDC006477]|uniref:hypothetical protein n=1 Tax=Streptomyces sp. NPDC006477 TaxID=3364747 RepID=UPI00367EE28F